MYIELNDSFDADWDEEHLYRELIIATSPSANAAIKYYRPLHCAVMHFDVALMHSESAIRQMLRAVSSSGSQRRYEKLVLVEDSAFHSQSSANIEEILDVLNSEFPVLLQQRRVYYAVVDSEAMKEVQIMESVSIACCLMLSGELWARPPGKE